MFYKNFCSEQHIDIPIPDPHPQFCLLRLSELDPQVRYPPFNLPHPLLRPELALERAAIAQLPR